MCSRTCSIGEPATTYIPRIRNPPKQQNRDISPRERRRSAGLRYQLSSKGFKTLTGLIGQAGLLGTLSSNEEFTVFAPSDAALGNFLASNPAVAESLEVKLNRKKT